MTERSSQAINLEDRFPEFTSLYFALRTIPFEDENERERLFRAFKGAPGEPLKLETLALVVVNGQTEAGVVRRKEGSQKKVEGLMLVLDGDLLSLQPQLKAVDQLAPETKVWIFEKGRLEGEEEKHIRLATLEAAGVVKRKLTVKDGFICWSGRTRKNREKTEIDLSQKPWFGPLARKTESALLGQGWENVDLKEAIDGCRHSTFPPIDLSNLKNAFGSKLRTSCGCVWHLTKNGTWDRERGCSPECEGKPHKYVPEEQRFYLGGNIPAERTNVPFKTCFDCGTGIVVNRRRITNLEGDLPFTEVLSEMVCPHHGSVGRPRRLTVGTYRLFEYQPLKERK